MGRGSAGCDQSALPRPAPCKAVSPNLYKLKVYDWVQSMTGLKEDSLYEADIDRNGWKKLIDVSKLYITNFISIFYTSALNKPFSFKPVIDYTRS